MGEFRTRPWFEISSLTNWKKVKPIMMRRGLEIYVQHYTTSGKLMMAESHFTQLLEMVPENRITALHMKMVQDTNGKTSAEFTPEFVPKAEEYLSERDGFLYTLRGSLDSFFWEVNLFFGLGLPKISYEKVKKKMKTEHCTKKTTKLLLELKNESWFIYLSNARNELTHHTASELVTFTEDAKIYLPSDPLWAQYKREERYEVPICLKDLRDKTVNFLEKGYDAMWDDCVRFSLS